MRNSAALRFARLPPCSFSFVHRNQAAFHEKPLNTDINFNREHLVLGQQILPISNQRGEKLQMVLMAKTVGSNPRMQIAQIATVLHD